MPRGSRRSSGRSSPTFGRAPPSPSRSSVPAQRPPSSVTQPPAASSTRQPGMIGQMASTAAGVAIGSTVGHAVSGALFGGSTSEQQVNEQQTAPAPGYQQPYQQPMSSGQQQQNPCQFELQQFVECAQGQADITLCQGFNEVLRQCKLSYGLS